MKRLLLIAVGPVQEFIAQARRSRDLWFGSHILSEISKAAARAIAAHGGTLIMPPMDNGDPHLEFRDNPTDDNGNSVANVANKILAVIPDTSTDIKEIAKKARTEAVQQWQRIAQTVKNKCAPLLISGTQPSLDEIWDEQISTLLEFYAVWTDEAFADADYAAKHEELERELAGRKNLRQFSQWKHLRSDVPKSSLDGIRETVLRDWKEIPDKQARKTQRKAQTLSHRLRISDGEQLDAVSLTKRGGGNPEQFIPLCNVALSHWVALAQIHAKKEMDHLRQTCSNVPNFPRTRRSDMPWTHDFPYDAEMFLEERWSPLCNEDGYPIDNVGWFEDNVRPVLKAMKRTGQPEPYPYVACLVADGDRVGKALDTIAQSTEQLPVHERQRQFVEYLGKFAGIVREVLEHGHDSATEKALRGMLIYAGGDDVLAFVAVPDAIRVAHRLQEEFHKLMKSACQEVGIHEQGDIKIPTLSVGLGIGHIQESMGYLLELGRQAEKKAKGSEDTPDQEQRNALAIILDKRSGGQHIWRSQWNTTPTPEDRMNKDIALLRDERLSSGKIYELRRFHEGLPHPKDAELTKEQSHTLCSLLQQEVSRILKRNEGRGSQNNSKPESKDILEQIPLHADLQLDQHKNSYEVMYKRLDQWIERMLVARFLATGPSLTR